MCYIPSNSKRDIILTLSFFKNSLSDASAFVLCCHQQRAAQKCSIRLVLHNNSFQISSLSVLIAASFCFTASNVFLTRRGEVGGETEEQGFLLGVAKHFCYTTLLQLL